MQREQILAAVCGSQRIVLALVHREDDGRLHVDAAVAENVPPLSPATTGAWDDAPWIDGLRRLLGERRWSDPVELLVAPPAEAFLLKTVCTPDLPAEQRTAVLRFEFEQALPVAPGELAWVSACTGRRGDELEHLVAATKRTELAPLVAAVGDRRGGARIVPLALALANLPAGSPDDGSRLALRVLAETTATLLVARCAGRTVVRSILHPTIDSADPADADRIAVEIARAVAVVRRQLGAEALGDLELGATAALALALAPRLRDKLGVTARTFAPEDGSSASAEVAPVELAGVLALAHCAFSGTAAALDLVPERTRREARIRRAQPLLRGLAAVLVLGPLVWSGVLWRETQTTRSLARQLAAEIAPLRKREHQRLGQLAGLHALQQKLAVLESVDAARSRWGEVFAALETQVTEESATWLEGIECVPPSAETGAKTTASPPAPTMAHDVFQVRLRAVTKHDPAEPTAALRRARALLARLAATAPFTAVDRVQFDDSDPTLLRFEAELPVGGKADR